MWLCILSGKRLEDTFENTQWGKGKQVQPMWLCILSGKRFEDTFENAQWRKVKQMQPVWLSGPNGIKNFNPGIFRDGILPNPGIPGFFGMGFSNIFDPGI